MSIAVADRLVQTFLDLVSIPSPARDERAVADWCISYLEGLGLAVVEDDAAECIPAGAGNLYVHLPPTAEGTPIFLCAHLDTVALTDGIVPVVGDDGVIRNSREAILGGDNKAAVAVMLELVREIVEQELSHAGIELVLTPCEELGLLGAKAFDTSILKARFGYCYDHANDIGKIVCEAPTQMSFTATIVGQAAHSGIAPEQGRHAIQAMARALSSLELGRIDERTTANVGIIEGGTAVNIIPERCTIRGEARSLDHERAAQVAQQMVDALAAAAVEFGCELDVSVREEYRAYSFTASSPPVKLIATALERAGYEPQLVPCGGGADANIFNASGVACVNVCNAMRDIHTSDEHIRIEDLEGMLRVSRELVSAAVR